MTVTNTSEFDADGYRVVVMPDAVTVKAQNGDEITYCAEDTAPFTITAWNAATPHPDNLPFWHQPFNPANNEPWASKADALNFAASHINSTFVNPPAPTAPSAQDIQTANQVLAQAGYTVTPPAAAAPAAAPAAPAATAAPAAPASN
jgi:plastocyanin